MRDNMRTPWTREELEYLIPQLEEKLVEDEQSQREDQLHGQDEVKPLPPMTMDECKDYIWRMMDAAKERPLTSRECFIFGQLLQALQQCVMAEMLGKKGRYYVVSEDQTVEILRNLQ